MSKNYEQIVNTTTKNVDAQRLRAESVSGIELVFMVVACAAPLTVVVGVPGLIWGIIGNPSTAAAFIASGIILGLFAVGYTAMSRFLSGPGGFGVYVDRAFGKNASGAISFVGLVGYGSFLLCLMGFIGYLAAPEFSHTIGLTLPWWIWSLITVGIIGVFGYINVNLSAKVLAILLSAEVIITLIMDIAILTKGGPNGLDMTSLSPSGLFSVAPAAAILFAVASYVGFESTTLYGEEVKNRTKTVPVATYAAVAIITLFYCFTFWAMGVGYGDKTMSAAQNSPGTFTIDLARNYAGVVAADIMNWLVLTSVLAACLAFHNGLSRYIFSLGRSGILPQKLGESHERHGSPYVASLVASAVTVVAIIIYAITGGKPYAQMYAWWAGIGTIGMLMLYVSGGIAVLRFLRTHRHHEQPVSLWQSTIAPILSLVGLLLILIPAIINFEDITGSNNQIVNLLWLLSPIAAVIGYLLSMRHFKLNPEDRGPSEF